MLLFYIYIIERKKIKYNNNLVRFTNIYIFYRFYKKKTHTLRGVPRYFGKMWNVLFENFRDILYGVIYIFQLFLLCNETHCHLNLFLPNNKVNDVVPTFYFCLIKVFEILYQNTAYRILNIFNAVYYSIFFYCVFAFLNLENNF